MSNNIIPNGFFNDFIDEVSDEVATAQYEENLSLYRQIISESKNIVNEYNKFSQLLIDYNEGYKNYAKAKERLKIKTNEKISLNSLKKQNKKIYNNIKSTGFREFYVKLLSYQRLLNEAIGQSTKTVYLYRSPNGKTVKILELDDKYIADSLQLGSNSGNLTLKFRNALHSKTGLGLLDNNSNKTLYENIKETQDETKLMATYNEVYRRGEISREKTFKYSNKRILLILWRPDGYWRKMIVSSFGDINEALLSFYLQKRFEEFNLPIENNVETFLLDKHSGVLQVDNLSGLLQGDITSGNIEYAAKSKGASELGYKQIISMAQALALSSPEKLRRTILQKKQELANKAKTRNWVLEEDLDKILEEKIVKAIGQLS